MKLRTNFKKPILELVSVVLFFLAAYLISIPYGYLEECIKPHIEPYIIALVGYLAPYEYLISGSLAVLVIIGSLILIKDCLEQNTTNNNSILIFN